VSAAAEAFAAEYGRSPEGVWAAPGRVNLIGEHTDYNDGFVLPLAIARRTELAAARRSDGRMLLRSRQCAREPAETAVQSRHADRLPAWARYPAGVWWALADAGHPVGGVELMVDGDVPLGSGLSSSAAIGCATALAADGLHGLGLARPVLAATVQQADHRYVGVPSGVMDQMASLCCEEGSVLLLDTRDLGTTSVPLDLTEHGLALLVVDTRVARRLVGSEYAERRRACEAAAGALGVAALRDASPGQVEALADDVLRRRARHVVGENGRVLAVVELLRSGRSDQIGPLLTASHASLRDDYEVSCPELDAAVEAALIAGALGARLTGAGFGGCAIALVRRPDLAAVQAALLNAFTTHGWAEPEVFEVTPSAGATRLQ
jgi:galactokinase